MNAQDLHDGWTLRATAGPVPAELAARLVEQTVPATVPGTTHTDLLDAGLIPDPYVDQAEAELTWIHSVDWEYARTLTAHAPAADERVDLVFDGLDTVAEIRLGGALVGNTANQHRSYRFDVREVLASADGEPLALTVAFRSALEHALAERDRLGARPGAYPHPLNMVRKMACSFGWDWGPDLQTAGIWRPVRLERWRTARIAGVRPLVTFDDGADPASPARVAVHVDVERSSLDDSPALPVVVTLTSPGTEHLTHDELHDLRRDAPLVVRGVIPAGADSAVLEVVVERPERWWPAGHGAQPLYGLRVALGGDRELGSWERRIGLRSVALDRGDDEHGTAFTFVVNGRPVFVKGANWIPDDHLLTRITRERLARRLDQATDAHLNLLRVWGGGIYESEDFYDLADERGLMVWQDFPLACYAYPEEAPLWDEFEAEAREHVARLSSHASLVLWNGGNENIWGFADWGWREALDGRTWGDAYYTDLFPRIVAELDPTRPYSDGSPYSPGHPELHPNDPDHGTHHQWEVWNRIDYTHYRDDVPRFSSEFGFQGPPTWATLERAVRNPDGAPLAKTDAVWLLHQKADDGNGKLDRGLEPHLGVPEDFSDWHWATQLNQARAVAHAIEHYRSWWPRTAGSIVWQLNDCWPVTSWAAVDGDERPKPLWWALRAAYAPRLLTVVSRDGREVLAVVNDTADEWAGAVAVSRTGLSGVVVATAALPVAVGPWSVALVELPDEVRVPDDAAHEVLVATLASDDVPLRAVHCWVEDVDLDLSPAPLEARAERVADGYVVRVVAQSLVKDLALHVDRLDPDAAVSSSLVTLPAGEAATLHVRTAVDGLEDALVSAPVLRTANDVVRLRSNA